MIKLEALRRSQIPKEGEVTAIYKGWFVDFSFHGPNRMWAKVYIDGVEEYPIIMDEVSSGLLGDLLSVVEAEINNFALPAKEVIRVARKFKMYSCTARDVLNKIKSEKVESTLEWVLLGDTFLVEGVGSNAGLGGVAKVIRKGNKYFDLAIDDNPIEGRFNLKTWQYKSPDGVVNPVRGSYILYRDKEAREIELEKNALMQAISNALRKPEILTVDQLRAVNGILKNE